MARKFKPESALTINVDMDTNLSTRLKGADSCTYIIDWKDKTNDF